MSADVLPFPAKPTGAKGWICGCGGERWVLFADGSVLCPECNCISTVLKVVHVPISDQP